MNSSRMSAQRGLTLIELMIAVIIGMLLAAGIGSVYISNKQSYNTREAMAALQENARTSLSQLQATVGPAGFPGIDNIEPIVVAGGGFTVAAPIAVSSDGAGTAPDTLSVALRNLAITGPVPLADCRGSPVLAGVTAISMFAVENQQLVCRSSINSAAMVIADNVEDMQVLYGVDPDGNGIANSFVTATNLGAAALTVVSVQVSLLLSSAEVNDAARSETLMVADQARTTNDRRIRRVVTTTIPLRNRVPPS